MILDKVKLLSFDLRYISGLATTTPGCLRSDLGELNFEVSPLIAKKIKELADKDTFSYAPTFGDAGLLKALEDFESENLKYYDDPKILVTAGGQAGLFATITSLVHPGEKILTDKYYYPPYANLAKLAEGTLVAHDLEDLDAVNPEKVKLLILNSPCNPNGRVQSTETLKKVAELAKKHNWIVLEDAVYNRIYFDTPPESIAAYCPERTLIINSASKNFCMPGIRIGWLYGPSELITEIAKMHRNMVSCPNAFFQKVMASFIPESDSFFKDVRIEMKKRRDRMIQMIKGFGWEFILPKGGIYVMAVIPGQKDTLKFVEKLIPEAKVSVMPGLFFGNHHDHVRICYGAVTLDQIDEMERRIQAFIG